MSDVNKGVHLERTRQKIRDANLVRLLLEYIHGEREMQPMQVTTALALLKKVTPDVRHVEIKAEVTHISKDQVEGALLEAGIDPGTAWKQLQ